MNDDVDRRHTGPAHEPLWLMGWRWHENLLLAPFGRYTERSVKFDRVRLVALRMIHGANLTTHAVAYNDSGEIIPQMQSVWLREGKEPA